MKKNRKIRRHSGEVKPYETDVKPLFYEIKVIPDHLHTSGVDLDESYTSNTVGKGDGTSDFELHQIRECEAFTN